MTSLRCQWCCQWYHCIWYITMIKIRCNTTFYSCDVITTRFGLTWFQWHQKMTSLHSFSEDNWNEVLLHHVMSLALVSVSHDADGINNGTFACRTTEKWYSMTYLVMWCHWHRLSSMWCWWHCQCHHCISEVKMIEMRCNMIFLVMWCHWHWCWHHMMPTASSMVSLHSLGKDNWFDET